MTSEHELLEQAKQFKSSALAEIYDLYSPKLFRYAVRMLNDAHVAEDCVAETFSRFLLSLRANNGPRDYLQAYLFRTIHNLIVDQFRRQPPVEPLTDRASDQETVEENAYQNIRRNRIRAAIRKLSPAQQQVIALKYLEGWDNEEIARALQKPVGAVKSIQHRALTQLQKILMDDNL